MLVFSQDIPTPFSWLVDHHVYFGLSIWLTALYVFGVVVGSIWLVRLATGADHHKNKVEE
jgi:thiol:disulfide interchange protein